VTCASKIAGMPCRVDAWDVWYHDLGYIDGSRYKTYACNFCRKVLLIEPLGCTGTWTTKVESAMSLIVLGCL
jgi:hypothetical protein